MAAGTVTGSRAALSGDCNVVTGGRKSTESREEEEVGSAQRQLVSYRKHLRKVKSVDFDASVEKELSGDPCLQAESGGEQPAHGGGTAGGSAAGYGGSVGAILMDLGDAFSTPILLSTNTLGAIYSGQLTY